MENKNYWSTKAKAEETGAMVWDSGNEWEPYNHWDKEDGRAWTFKILDFNGIELQRTASEEGILAPNSLEFSISNAGNSLTPSDFNGGKVVLSLRVGDGTNVETIFKFRFKIKQTEPAYQRFRVICDDFLQEYLRGDWPSKKLIKDINPSDDA